ncbi:WD40-like Beta Propeller Repeat [Mariniphaga anaerophila]|uniref:WD40-like Beta Propeller Repeat n=1 Tax=Mariniphaga anaerophila TaxID=1484053 RepID=A0A1M5GCQ7_9BACT|nr:PD40 domain-containing protein [Mariniphaga anaerophila]SHG01476.1 WD40-like Beta Propeller Repeat [Mariniphaga anaerophila]
MSQQIKYPAFFILLILCSLNSVFYSCTQSIPETANAIDRVPEIYPDYTEITVPANIAPLNFQIDEEYERFLVKFSFKGKTLFTIPSSDGEVIIPAKKWKSVLEACKGESYSVEVFAQKNREWFRFSPFSNFVADDSIDKYLVYRLIAPGFETWGEMGIYQRCLEDFTQTPIVENRMTGDNCMNCHSFSKNRSETMLFHMRAKHGGTVILKNNELTKVDTKRENTISAGVYPSWHPGGRLVAFSVNNIVQTFHAIPDKKVEVFDLLSDLIIYDTEDDQVTSGPEVSSPDYFETFPTWSPDGKTLFFCRAEALPAEKYDEIRYDLYKVGFSEESKSFGELVSVLNVSQNRKSVTFPRISPDGKYLLFCLVDYGNFSIWHNESDLYCLNLETGEVSEAAPLNSNYTESYHSWSANGKWVVFSSRRSDGLYTKPYIGYFSDNGSFSKPFVLPQKKPDYYTRFLKSFNIPEFVTSKVDFPTQDFLKMIE